MSKLVNGAYVSANTDNPGTIFANFQLATVGDVALPAHPVVNSVVLLADEANTGVIYIGPAGVTTVTGYPLKAGESISYAVTDLSQIHMIGANTTDKLHFTGN